MKKIILALFVFFVMNINAQDKKVSLSVWDGAIVAGYVDDGGFVNLGGPSIKWNQKPYTISLGLLPSLKIKEDKSLTTKNSLVTPSLGAGLTFNYKHFVVQVPMYYSAKTATTNGIWNVGFGIGYKL